MKQTEIPYQKDSAALFSKIAHEEWAIYLDSAYAHTDVGRYDIFSARPITTITTHGEETEVVSQSETITSNEDPFEIIKQHLQKQEIKHRTSLPFNGGALGLFSYDLGRQVEKLPDLCETDITMPDMAVGIYDWAVVIDHHQRRAWLVSAFPSESTLEEWDELVALFSNHELRNGDGYKIYSKPTSNMSEEFYADAFNKIKLYIKEGDCYQVNLAQRFSAELKGDPWSVYLTLRKNNPAPYSSFFNLKDCAILSSSPERFLKLQDSWVETKPIKGTKPRSMFAYEDKALAASLLESEKDRAENVMIVDLLRNDIGKTCEIGTVNVPKLFSLESYATVHHLVSTVTGRLDKRHHALDLLRGSFPGGSITGAPKLRAMEIIEELEPHRRHVYCGSLGYIGFDGNMDTNIAIRTMVMYENKIHFWAGGGIVMDSEMESEYKECFHKAAGMMKLFE